MTSPTDKTNWRNRYYGLPDKYDANTTPQGLDGTKVPGNFQPKVIDKILHEAAKRAKAKAKENKS